MVGVRAATPNPSAKDARRTVRDVMTRQVLCVSPDQPLAEVASLMVNKDLPRVPVVRDGRLVGLLTRGDIVRKLIGIVTSALRHSHRPPFSMASDRTLAIIKPDALGRGLAGRVIAHLEETGFRVTAARVLHLTDRRPASSTTYTGSGRSTRRWWRS